MNSFNRISYTYKLTNREKKIYNNNNQCWNFEIRKNAYICNGIKQLKLQLWKKREITELRLF